MTDTTEAGAKKALTDRMRALIGREEKITKHLRGEDGRLEADFGDVGSIVAADEVLEGLEDAALAEIREIRAALARLDDGTYGTCVRCGGPISAGRLAAMPHAALCVTCAT